MGASGPGSFENDRALDWISELEADGIEAIRDALQPGARDIDVEDAQAALAAAEVVATARGHGVDDLPDEIATWIDENAENITDEDVALARHVVARVRESSELREIWVEDDPDEWLRVTASLVKRLARCA